MPKTEEKTLLVIGAAIVVIAFLAGGLWWRQNNVHKVGIKNKNEIADWQTYRNETYGFEIKYPNDWMATEFLGGEHVDFSPLGVKHLIQAGAIGMEISISVLPYRSWGGNAEAFINKRGITEKKEIKFGIGNYNGIETKEGHPSLGYKRTIYVDRESVSVFYALEINENTAFMSVFNQILSTFKFIE